MNAVIEARRNEMLKRIRRLKEEAEELATQMRCSDRLRGTDYMPVDIAEVDIAASHLNIGFLLLARALPFDR